MYKYTIAAICVSFMMFLMFSCESTAPNLDNTGEDELKAHEIDHRISKAEINFQDVIYVPIYSDIYVDQQNQETLLSATLSIRNTSYRDTLFISKIDYFNTNGNPVRSFIDKPISVSPMGTINYVIERDDNSGGSGANFIVDISSRNKDIRPLIQAVMIGQTGNKGFAFSTDGYSLKN